MLVAEDYGADVCCDCSGAVSSMQTTSIKLLRNRGQVGIDECKKAYKLIKSGEATKVVMHPIG